MGRWASIIGVFVAILTAYAAKYFSNILVYMQVLVMFFIIPLFGVVILGMLWKRPTAAGGFWGFLAGILFSIGEFVYVHLFPGYFNPSALNPEHVTVIALTPLAQDMAVNMYSALWSLIVCMGVTVIVSLFTRPKRDEELKDLVYGLTVVPDEGPTPWYKHPNFWAAVVLVVLVMVNIAFW